MSNKFSPLVLGKIMYPVCGSCGGHGRFNVKRGVIRKCATCNGTGRRDAKCGNGNCA